MHPEVTRSQVSRYDRSWRAATFVGVGQWGFAVGVALCVAIHPGFVLKANEGGVSDYGVHVKTAVPYYLALALAAGGAYLAASHARDSTNLPTQLRAFLLGYAVLLVLTLASTIGYTLDKPQRDVHVGVGIALTVFEVVASLWMYRERRGDLGLVLVQLAGVIVAALTIVGLIHLLFVTEIVTGASFAVLLFRTTRQLSTAIR
jgi:heme/copper-type cytochrome/quinol oxidase subunit 4